MPGSYKIFGILYVPEVLAHVYNKLLYKTGQDFLDKQYVLRKESRKKRKGEQIDYLQN